MRQIEDLLRRDRESQLPELPDTRYTAAVVKRRLGETPVQPPEPDIDWPLIAACGGLVVGGALTAVGLGLNPWWLLVVPSSVFPLFPILLRKGAR